MEDSGVSHVDDVDDDSSQSSELSSEVSDSSSSDVEDLGVNQELALPTVLTSNVPNDVRSNEEEEKKCVKDHVRPSLLQEESHCGTSINIQCSPEHGLSWAPDMVELVESNSESLLLDNSLVVSWNIDNEHVLEQSEVPDVTACSLESLPVEKTIAATKSKKLQSGDKSQSQKVLINKKRKVKVGETIWPSDALAKFYLLVREKYQQLCEAPGSKKKRKIWQTIHISVQEFLPEMTLQQVVKKWRAQKYKFLRFFHKGHNRKFKKPLHYDLLASILLENSAENPQTGELFHNQHGVDPAQVILPFIERETAAGVTTETSVLTPSATGIATGVIPGVTLSNIKHVGDARSSLFTCMDRSAENPQTTQLSPKQNAVDPAQVTLLSMEKETTPSGTGIATGVIPVVTLSNREKVNDEVCPPSTFLEPTPATATPTITVHSQQPYPLTQKERNSKRKRSTLPWWCRLNQEVKDLRQELREYMEYFHRTQEHELQMRKTLHEEKIKVLKNYNRLLERDKDGGI